MGLLCSAPKLKPLKSQSSNTIRMKPKPSIKYSLRTYSDDSLRAIAAGTNPVMAKVAQEILNSRKCPYPLQRGS